MQNLSHNFLIFPRTPQITLGGGRHVPTWGVPAPYLPRYAPVGLIFPRARLGFNRNQIFLNFQLFPSQKPVKRCRKRWIRILELYYCSKSVSKEFLVALDPDLMFFISKKCDLNMIPDPKTYYPGSGFADRCNLYRRIFFSNTALWLKV